MARYRVTVIRSRVEKVILEMPHVPADENDANRKIWDMARAELSEPSAPVGEDRVIVTRVERVK